MFLGMGLSFGALASGTLLTINRMCRSCYVLFFGISTKQVIQSLDIPKGNF